MSVIFLHSFNSCRRFFFSHHNKRHTVNHCKRHTRITLTSLNFPPIETFRFAITFTSPRHVHLQCLCILLTCVVMSQPSSRLSRTDEPLSRSSTRFSASCRILCSCGKPTYVNTCTYNESSLCIHYLIWSIGKSLSPACCIWRVSHR